MANTILDLTEEHFGEQLGPDLIRHLEGAQFDTYRVWQRAVRAFSESAQLESRPSGQIRPYIPTERSRGRDVAHDFHLRPSDFADLAAVEVGFQSLKHHLLYCHSLAFDDPLPWLLDMFVLDDSNTVVLGSAKEKVLNCMQFLSWIKPLIDARVVVLVENPLATDNGVELVSNPKHFVESADFSDVSELLAATIAQYGDFSKESILYLANLFLGQSMQAIARHPFALDLYLPYRHYEALLAAAIMESASTRGADEAGQIRILRNLLNLGVPGLAHLEVRDLVAIRTQDSAFETWRRALEHGLDRIDQLDPDALGAGHESIRVIRQELEYEGRALEAQIDRSEFLSKVKASRTDMAVSAFGATLTGTPPIGLAAKTGGLLWEALLGRRRQQDRISTLQHYLLFSPAPVA